ncbi:MAG: DNA gyrase subunit A [Thermoguttaceae bacterium]|nr:DNA gyrase subunit A [Thermoguttaceae bacterium]MDW8079868.1 DNA gyrase subunit A [Thermoguttaceae bacterium]
MEEELKESYLTYAMSVIISRALPDVRDGLKPSQRRILVAMNDLGLTPGAPTAKCAAIVGETMKRYHPHGDQAIYPTLVRMGQEWNTRYPLIDKQGNFGSIAGLPPAAMRYTEARLSPIGALMLEDFKLDTVDFVPTYDEKGMEPTVLPSRFPNLLANGSQGIAVGMATSIPPHNLGEICDALVRLIDDPDVSIDELLEICPGPDFPTGGIICGRSGIRQGYHTGRGTITVRARTRIEESSGGRYRIIVSEIPYQQTRDRIEEEIAQLVNDGKITGIANIRNESDLREPVRIVLELKRDAEPEVVLNQLYTFSPLQDSFSLIFLALVDGKPRILNFKELLEEYLRHRVIVIRRRTRHLLQKARQRKHTVEGLLIALANIDEVIRVIRTSEDQEQAKDRLMQIRCPAALLQRALGPEGFRSLQEDRGVAEEYALTRVQAEAILRMTLAHLVNLEQQKLADEYHELLTNIAEYLRLLSDERNILAVIREDLLEIKRKFGDARRTEISEEEIEGVDVEALIPEEQMVVSISSAGYIKRTSIKLYRAQRRGGKGLLGARTQIEDPIEHLFIASTHDYMLFFTNLGKVYWRKVYELPEMGRDGRGRAIVNLLQLSPGEKVTDCRAVRNFDEPGQYLMMATRRGLVKKTALSAFGRPMRTGIIAIRLREGDELVDVVVTKEGDEVLLATAHGWAIRFKQSDVRPMGRAASGVRGISLRPGDYVVGMVVADPEGTLLTACQHGYGKRTPFGPNLEGEPEEALPELDAEDNGEEVDAQEAPEVATVDEEGEEGETAGDGEEAEPLPSQFCYRTQRRGGKGIRDIKTSARNGLVIGITAVRDDDEVLMITARGKIQRIAAREIRVSGRNTQGVKIMSLDEGDSLVAVKRVPREDEDSNGAG